MLKTIVSIVVFVDGSTRKESELNSVRSSIVNNSALAKASRAIGLEKYLIHRPLRIKEYVPVGFRLEGHPGPATQDIPRKVGPEVCTGSLTLSDLQMLWRR
jgi:hypothetical protein